MFLSKQALLLGLALPALTLGSVATAHETQPLFPATETKSIHLFNATDDRIPVPGLIEGSQGPHAEDAVKAVRTIHSFPTPADTKEIDALDLEDDRIPVPGVIKENKTISASGSAAPAGEEIQPKYAIPVEKNLRDSSQDLHEG